MTPTESDLYPMELRGRAGERRACLKAVAVAIFGFVGTLLAFSVVCPCTFVLVCGRSDPAVGPEGTLYFGVLSWLIWAGLLTAPWTAFVLGFAPFLAKMPERRLALTSAGVALAAALLVIAISAL